MNPARRQAAPAGTFEAVVANTNPLTVTIASFDGGRQEWPCRWQSGGERVPVRGDECLVARSDVGAYWVLVGLWSGEA